MTLAPVRYSLLLYVNEENSILALPALRVADIYTDHGFTDPVVQLADRNFRRPG